MYLALRGRQQKTAGRNYPEKIPGPLNSARRSTLISFKTRRFSKKLPEMEKHTRQNNDKTVD
jgi:hypothetical protein